MVWAGLRESNKNGTVPGVIFSPRPEGTRGGSRY